MPLVPINPAPGVQRDGTLLDSSACVEAEWCRWHRGRPKKMGGYRELTRNLSGVGRGVHVDAVNNYIYTHVGTRSALERLTINMTTGAASGVIDRTPAGFSISDNNVWQFDSEFDAGSSLNYLLAHAAPNLASVASDTARPVYYGSQTAITALSAIASSSVSGGIVVLHPYLFVYGSDGYLGWSVAGDPTDLVGAGSGAVRPTASKIVKGLPLRAGPGTSPAGLFWSLDTLSRVAFVGGASIFSFDTISASASILSPQSVIEHNGVYYWLSTSGFLAFNGVIREVENEYNHDWFFKNVNMDYSQKIFAIKIPKWQEIWWCFPKGSATECDWAVVYKYSKNIWYDTPIRTGGRSSGFYEQVFPYPIMTGAAANDSGKYSLWQHEYGVNEVSGVTPTDLAIKSSYRTNYLTAIKPSDKAAGQDRSLSVSIIEPDFNQIGDMMARLYVTPNAMVEPVLANNGEITIPATTSATVDNQDQQPAFTVTERLLQFEFESNVVNGDFFSGVVLAHVEDGDDRRIQ